MGEVTCIWERVITIFANGGSFAELRVEFFNEGVHGTVRMHLKALHAALHGVQEAYKRLPNVAGHGIVMAVVDTMLAMISCGNVFASMGMPTWRSLRKRLTEASLGQSTLPVASLEPSPGTAWLRRSAWAGRLRATKEALCETSAGSERTRTPSSSLSASPPSSAAVSLSFPLIVRLPAPS